MADMTPEQEQAVEALIAFGKAFKAGAESFATTFKTEYDNSGPVVVEPTPTPVPAPTPQPSLKPAGIDDPKLQLVWNEEFDKNLNNWRLGSRDKAAGPQASPGYPNKEAQLYNPGQVAVKDGQMVITAANRYVKVVKVSETDPLKGTIVKKAGTQTDPDIFYWPYYEGLLPYQSGWAMTGPDDNGWTANWQAQPALREFLYGVFEFKVKQPKGKGNWTAAWMLRSDRKNADEIDVFEMVDPAARSLAYHYHYGSGNGTDWTLKEGIGADSGVDLSQDFHTVSVDWTPEYIRWYLDGKPVQSTEGKLDKSVICNSPMYIILNYAIGGPGSWPDQYSGSAASFPQSLLIDYVRVWQRK